MLSVRKGGCLSLDTIPRSLFIFQDPPFTQNQTFNHPIISNQTEEEPPKPDFKINQPVTTCQHITADLPKDPSLTSTANRVSALIHNYNLYGNVREAQHIYGNTEFQSSSDEPKVDSAPMESVKSRVQAISGKIDSPPIYTISKKMIEHTDQG